MELKEKVVEAKEILGVKAAEIIAEKLNIEQWNSTALKGCCPFHREDTPSFIWSKKGNTFHCFGCGVKFDIIDFYMKDENLSYIDAVEKLFKQTDVVCDIKKSFEPKENPKERKDYFKNYIFPKEIKNPNRERVEKYLGLRHISKETLDYADVKQDFNGNIAFEHRDVDGKLLCTKIRLSRKLTKKDQKAWWVNDANQRFAAEDTSKTDAKLQNYTCPILYGVDKIDVTKPLLITEGHIDRLSCIEAGFTNVVSIPHGANDLNWIEFNWEWLENFETIILWADNDDPGEKMIKDAVIRIGEAKCKIVEPDETTEGKVVEYYNQFSSLKEAINKTDANNVLISGGKTEVMRCIKNAKDVPIPDVSKLMACEEFDINKAMVLPTGTRDFDAHIFGYIEGTLNIWTGRTGSGKSTYIIGSCLLEAVNEGQGTLIYSGELTQEQLKNWVSLQAAGREHVIEWDNGEYKPKTYSVTKQAKKKIENEYMDLIYVYDSYLIATPEKVIATMENMRKKHGIKNFIIDNLMCLELDIVKHGNELNAQKNLIIQFLQFAVRFGAIVHLVAHPRKPSGEMALTEYDILGSSNIPNLAHRIFYVKRMDEEEKMKSGFDASVGILKDRVLGVTRKEVGLTYDVPSRRMYGENDNLNKRYNWDKVDIIYGDENFGENGRLISKKSVYNQDYTEVFGDVQTG